MIMKRLKEDHEVFQSNELSLVAALVSWNFQIIKVDKLNPKKVFFVFLKTPELEQAIESFWNGSEATIPIRYFNALRECKSRIYAEGGITK